MKKFLATLVLLFLLVSSTTSNLVEASEVEESYIPYGTIVEEEAVIQNSTSEYTIDPIPATVTAQDIGNNSVEGNSNYVDPMKMEYDAGMYYVNYEIDNAVVEYSDGVVVNTIDLSSSINTNSTATDVEQVQAEAIATTSDENEYFVVENGIITEASEANIITLGGADTTKFMYETVEDAYLKQNGTTISGGAEVASYTETISYNGEDFVKITMAGYEGYMSINDVQIIPSYIEMNTTYYFANDGVWYCALAMDPLVSSDYMVMPISDAPAWAVEGTKYYSDDQVNFTTDEYMGPETYANYENQAYFQNLSIRSTTIYSGAQFQSYLSYLGKTSSQYYNATSAFIDAQNLYGVNGLLLFSMANLESGYGTSTYSYKCNNFFGRSAYDSDPDQACSKHDYATPRDGILSQAIFLSQEYADQYYSVYHGTYTGNKNGGMNVSYASDSSWGQKIASIAYECDRYLGGFDNNYFKIVEVNSVQTMYKDSSLTTPLRAQGDWTPGVDQDNPNSYINAQFQQTTSTVNPRVVVVAETSNAYKVQIENPVDGDSSGFETYTSAKHGSHPYYEGGSKDPNGHENTDSENYVTNGYMNFAAEYNSFSRNQMWIPKSSATVVADNEVHDTQRQYEKQNCTDLVKEYYNSNNDLVKEYKSTDGTSYCIYTYYGSGSTIKTKDYKYYANGTMYEHIIYQYDNNGKLKNRDLYKYDTSGRKDYFADTNYSTSTGYITSYKEYYYDNNEKRTQRNEKDYYTNGKSKQLTKYYYNSSNQLYNRELYKYDDSGRQDYYADTNYNPSNGYIKDYKEYYYDNNEKRTQRNEKVYYSNGKSKQLEKYYYNSSNKLYNRELYKYNDGGKKTYYADTNYNTSTGKISNYKEYYYNTSGVRTQRNEKYYYSSGAANYKVNYYYGNDGEYDYKNTYYY